MLRYCLNKWYQNQDKLKDALANDVELGSCRYKHIVELTTKYILNDGETDDNGTWSVRDIVEINHGDYQGTLLYVIPANTYQPSCDEYLTTYVNYGSCSGCDTLQHLQCYDPPAIKDYMVLCKDLITNMTHPFGNGWRSGELDETVEMN